MPSAPIKQKTKSNFSATKKEDYIVMSENSDEESSLKKSYK